ncbi:MAG: hypothetical protein ACKV2T_17685, partial [Kofleriaceae bacterium]
MTRTTARIDLRTPFVRSTIVELAILAFLVSGCAGAPRPMQLRRVTLYQNGIGYFERTGVLGGKTLRLELASLAFLVSGCAGAPRPLQLRRVTL